MKFQRQSVALTIICLVLGAASAQAQESRPGRYTMHKSDDGFVRLDTETGAVSLCRKSGDGWGCRAMSGSFGQSSRPSNDLDRLQAENAELKAEVKRLEELLELRGSRKHANKPSFKLPTEQEVDQALNYFERMLKKFQDRLKRLENKSDTPDRKL